MAPTLSFADVVHEGAMMAAQGSGNGNFGRGGGGRVVGFGPGFQPGFNLRFGGRGRRCDFIPSCGRRRGHGGYGGSGFNGYNSGYHAGGRGGRPYGGAYGGGHGRGNWPNHGQPYQLPSSAPGQGGHPVLPFQAGGTIGANVAAKTWRPRPGGRMWLLVAVARSWLLVAMARTQLLEAGAPTRLLAAVVVAKLGEGRWRF